jgi:hypothetical protein
MFDHLNISSHKLCALLCFYKLDAFHTVRGIHGEVQAVRRVRLSQVDSSVLSGLTRVTLH